MVSIAICDDELMFRDYLKKELNNTLSSDKIKIYEYADGEDMIVDACENMFWDVIFMDIKMNKVSGQEVIKKIRTIKNGKNSIVVFLTSYDSNITEIVSLKPYAYIYKNKVEQELEKLIKEIFIELENNEKKLVFHENRKEYKLKQGEIKYMESYKNTVTIVTPEEKYITRDYSLVKLSESLTNPYFFQCCSSAILNYRYIKCIKHDRIVMDDGKEFKIGRKFKRIVNEKIIKTV